MKNLTFTVAVFGLLFVSQEAAGARPTTKELYEKANAYREFYSSRVYYMPTRIQPVDSTHLFWYSMKTPDGTEWMTIDADKGSFAPAFDRARMAAALSSGLGREVEPGDLPLGDARMEEGGRQLAFSLDGNDYKVDLAGYTVTKSPTPANPRAAAYWGSQSRENSGTPVASPDGKREAYIREGNVWMRDVAGGGVTQLSFDGAPAEYYSSRMVWSPDSRHVVAMKYRPAEVRKLTMVSSSPRDRLQPVIETFDYNKPGDALPVRRPVLFNVESGTSHNFDTEGIENQFSLGDVRWEEDSSGFTFELNWRGHQRYTLFGMDTAGRQRTVYDETSPTFIYYNMLEFFWLKNSDEVVVLSERTGWKHLHIVNKTTGAIKQLTTGEWIVKRVVAVDEKSGRIIFIGCGMEKGVDPYFTKYYSVEIKSGRITPLTPESGNHVAQFSYDHAFMVDTWSTVDTPPTTVLRRTTDGRIVGRPQRQADISEALAAGWRAPEPFVAKGRDGVTDIWGIIIRPTDFDPAKKYPVIENIYAGPHDSFVPKSFSIAPGSAPMAELGFILVHIDGMGTYNRSKEFHDVCWQNIKDAGFPDRIAWMKAAAADHPEMDISRVGIYGTSAGGQNAMGALLFHPEFYKVGVASCGCHDNRMDKIWWNEQWMGYPVGPHYAANSNMENAHLLRGKLLLMVGELDNNVDPASTYQVVDRLVEHNKDFEFYMFPGQRHSGGGDYGERKRRDFFMRHLLDYPMYDWNASL
jgi:dipeptidyl aminopeptidase/acylaminoacyl peptidase